MSSNIGAAFQTAADDYVESVSFAANAGMGGATVGFSWYDNGDASNGAYRSGTIGWTVGPKYSLGANTRGITYSGLECDDCDDRDEEAVSVIAASNRTMEWYRKPGKSRVTERAAGERSTALPLEDATFAGALRQAGVVAPLVLERPDERGGIPGLRGAATGADPPAGRHRGRGQPLGAQDRGGPRGDRGAPRRPGLPAAPYSPDLNPIEQLFAKLRVPLRKAARTVCTLWTAIGALPESFEPAECANYFRHAGYGST